MRVVPLLVLAACLAYGAWLVTSSGSRSGDVAVLEATPSTERAVPLMAAPPELRAPAGHSAANAPADDDAADDDRGAPRAVDLGAAGRALAIRGTVVDADGEPVVGARVHVVPNGAALRDAGVEPESYFDSSVMMYDRHALDAVALRELPSSATGQDGAFTLEGRHVDVEPSSVNDGSPWTVLVISADGHAVRCERLEVDRDDDGVDVGSLALAPEMRIAGRLVDEGGDALADEHVVLWTLRPAADVVAPPRNDRLLYVPELMSTRSDAEGRFELGGLWPGEALLVVHPEGRVRTPIEAAASTGRSVDVGDVVVPRGEVVAGRVVDAAGAPVAGAEVLVTDRELTGGAVFDVGYRYEEGDDAIHDELETVREGKRWLPVSTDSEGRFVLRGLDEPNLTVYVDADRFEPTRVREVAAGRRDLVVPLVREALLVVRVVDGDGEPLEDAEVAAQRLSGIGRGGVGNVALDVVFGDDAVERLGEPVGVGAVVVARVGPVGTRLSVSAPGKAAQQVDAPGVVPPARETFTVTLDDESVIRGRVVDVAGVPVEAADVLLAPPGHLRAAGVAGCTDADGRFEVGNLGALEVDVLAHADGYAESPSVRVALAANETHDDVELVLPRPATLRGVATAADGEPRGGLHVVLDTEPYGSFKFWETSPFFDNTARTDEDGSFVFYDVPPRRYQLRVGKAWSRELDLVAGEETELAVRLEAPGTVRGRVTRGGAPVEDVGVTARAAEGRSELRSGRTDTEGRYTVEVIGGASYTLSVRPAGSPKAEFGPFDVPYGGDVVVDVPLDGGTISGRLVLDVDGSPVAQASVSLLAEDDRIVASATSDDDGAVHFEGAPSGRYRIRASGYASRDGRRKRAYRSAETAPFDVGEADVVDAPPLVLSAGARISGRVTNASGVVVKDRHPVHLVRWVDGGVVPGVGALITFRDGAMVHVESTNEQGLWDETWTDDGRYTFERLPPGEYRVLASDADGEVVAASGVSVIVEENGERVVDLVAPPD